MNIAYKVQRYVESEPGMTRKALVEAVNRSAELDFEANNKKPYISYRNFTRYCLEDKVWPDKLIEYTADAMDIDEADFRKGTNQEFLFDSFEYNNKAKMIIYDMSLENFMYGRLLLEPEGKTTPWNASVREQRKCEKIIDCIEGKVQVCIDMGNGLINHRILEANGRNTSYSSNQKVTINSKLLHWVENIGLNKAVCIVVQSPKAR